MIDNKAWWYRVNYTPLHLCRGVLFYLYEKLCDFEIVDNFEDQQIYLS